MTTVDTTSTPLDDDETTGAEASGAEATDTEPAGAEPPDTPVPGRWRSRRWTIATGAACVVLAVVGGLQLLQWRSLTAQERAASSASEAAGSGVVTLLSYDYRTITADMARARPLLTTAFAQQYDSVAASTVIPAATSQKVITSAVVTGSSVVSRSETTVVLLMFVNQTSTSSVGDKPEQGIDLSRVRVTMQRVGDSWRIADVRGL